MAQTPPSLNLPTAVSGILSVTLDGPAVYSCALSDVPSGFALENQAYGVWSSNPTGAVPGQVTDSLGILVNPGGVANYSIYSSYDGNLPTDGTAGNPGGGFSQVQEMQLVNYVLNFPKGKNGTLPTTLGELQGVIWQLLNPSQFVIGSFSDNGLALYNDALINGLGFVPQAGQKIAVVMAGQTPGNSPQPFASAIVAVQVPSS